MSRFQLRKAAGSYWLIDMEQKPFGYVRPLELNEVAATIYKGKEKGLTEDEIAEILSGEYGVSKEEVIEDVREFARELQNYEKSIGSEDE